MVLRSVLTAMVYADIAASLVLAAFAYWRDR